MIFLCQTIVQQNGLCMADMQITVRLRGESCTDCLVLALLQILFDDLFNKILGYGFVFHMILLYYAAGQPLTTVKTVTAFSLLKRHKSLSGIV